MIVEFGKPIITSGEDCTICHHAPPFEEEGDGEALKKRMTFDIRAFNGYMAETQDEAIKKYL